MDVLTTPADDESAYIITMAFNTSTSATPNAVVWTLTDYDGVTVNSRTGTTETPAASIAVLLSGDDLKASDGFGRILTVTSNYDGDGSTAVPLTGAVKFDIRDFTGI